MDFLSCVPFYPLPRQDCLGRVERLGMKNFILPSRADDENEFLSWELSTGMIVGTRTHLHNFVELFYPVISSLL